MKILVTGAAGFIGYHLAKRLLAQGNQVYGIDNLNDYYDVNLKQARLAQLLPQKRFTFKYLDISDRISVAKLFEHYNFDCVINLAAQAGVRYSLQNPHAYIENKPIDVYNYGKMKRDFTYIDDIVEAIVKIVAKKPQTLRDRPSYKIYNLGNNSPIELNEFITTIEQAMGKPALKHLLPIQPGDVIATYADIDELIADFDFKPTTSITQGIEQFVNWYQEYYGKNQELIFAS